MTAGTQYGIDSTHEVSIHPDSKYQEALARRIPIVKPSYLEAVWETKRLVDVQYLGMI